MTAASFPIGGGGVRVLCVFALVGLVLSVVLGLAQLGVALPEQSVEASVPEVEVPPVPSLSDVHVRMHAVERHGNSAITAWLAVRSCGDGLVVYFCEETDQHPPAFIFLCESVDERCAGVIIGSQGTLLSGWVGSCGEWDRNIASCLYMPTGGEGDGVY